MLRGFLQHWNPRVDVSTSLRQAGALPYSVIDGRLAVLLITSRRTGRWIFPKGGLEPGMTAWDSAAREALEEAGVTGTVEQEPIGSYRTATGPDRSILVDVDIYPLRVDTQLDSWREMDQRLRHWAALNEARRLLADPALVRLVTSLNVRLAPG